MDKANGRLPPERQYSKQGAGGAIAKHHHGARRSGVIPTMVSRPVMGRLAHHPEGGFIPLNGAELEFFHSVAGDRDPPERHVRELWCVVGRRDGKDSVASVIAAYAAAMFTGQKHLRPGERGLVMCLACDRDQSRIVLNYTRSYFHDMLEALTGRNTAIGFELKNGVDVAVATNSFRSVRGRPIVCAIFDEVAFWRDETSSKPDEETLKAIMPALASIPGSIVIGISSPYRKSGLLYKKYKQHFGRNGDVLVIKAPTSCRPGARGRSRRSEGRMARRVSRRHRQLAGV